MAHPFRKFNESDAGKARAKHLTKAYAKGGKVHSDAAEDRKLIKKMMAEHERGEMKVEGRASGGRLDKFARGGKTKSGKTNINIVIAPQGSPPAPGGARAAPVPIPVGGPPPMPPPGAGGPGGPPMPPPGMMQRGGRAKLTAGAETGVGRLQKAKALKGK